MLLKKIVLNDFGIYRGHNEFDFETAPGKPIVICGGKNGAGKTTLFESIMLCLYGQKSFTKKHTQKQYNEKILKSFHRYIGTKKSAEDISIVVEFQYAHDGSVTEYQITRMWQNNSGTIRETLLIRKKTLTSNEFVNLDSVEESEWQLFIDQLLPKGITNLFFFDGEQIQRIADSGNEGQYIRSSFDTLLGLDLVKQLHDDVGLYILRDFDGETKQILDGIEKNTQEKLDAEKKIESYQEKQVYLQGKISDLQRKLEIQEEKFMKIGGMFAKRREELMVQKVQVESQLETIEKQIRVICSDTLPFALIPKQMYMLRDEIILDRQNIQRRFERSILDKNFEDLLESIKSMPFFSTSDEATHQIEDIFCKKLESIPNADDTTFNLSIDDMNYMVGFIDRINHTGALEIKEYEKSHNDCLESLRNIQSALDVSPKHDEVGPVFSEITRINRDIGELEAEMSHLKDLESQEKSMIVLLNSKIRQNLAKRTLDKRRLLGLELGPKVQDVLDEYARLLRSKKIEILEQCILDGIKRFFHKRNFIERISIDKETFEVRLYGKDDDEITKDMLSQGELQMHATAIIWGLAKTSDRPLPFIIDTPLARLDVEHRENLIDNFYPFASHQTIILSTDSEIGNSYYARLEPYISKAMMIIYDSDDGRTTRHDGYFEGGNIIEDVRN